MNQNISKVLVFGPSNGNFKKIFEKTDNLNKKHHFDFLLCIGDFFPEFNTNDSEVIDLIEKKIHVPITTYFSIGKQRLHKKIQEEAIKNNGKICDNLFYIGKSGTLITSKGIKISYLGGMYKEEVFSSKISKEDAEIEQYIYEIEIENIIKHKENTDILITFEWPKNICRFSYQKLSKPIDGIQLIAKIVSYLQPKYHFSSNGSIFYEREPYKNILTKNKEKPSITRFISLGSLDNLDKERSSYVKFFLKKKLNLINLNQAFTIIASDSCNISDTLNISNITENPFIEEINTDSNKFKNSLKKSHYNFSQDEDIFPNNNKRHKCNIKTYSEPYEYINKKDNQKTENFDQIPNGYICKICNKSDHLIYNCPESNTKKFEKENDLLLTYTCQICSKKGHRDQNCTNKKNTNSRKIVYHGPKSNFCFFCLSNPKIAYHLIISIGSESYLALPKGPLTTTSTNSPILSFSGHVLIIPIAHVPTINSVEEINRNETKKEMERYRVSINEMFESKGCNSVAFEISRTTGIHLHWQVIPIKKDLADKLENAFISFGNEKKYVFEKRDIEKNEENYLRIWLPDGSILIHTINPQKYFDLQFARHVISQVLGVEERKDWKNCIQTNEEECQDATQFKKHFKDFDFTV
ncbi:hypothetical protein PCANB_001354 [Pneumocystis canis]|nr:hypothetical protein PCANB_001354 [Pneumocystis canis]